jgi:hypothetical protein
MSTASVIPDEFENDFSEFDSVEVPESERPSIQRIQSLRQLQRSFEFVGQDYQYRIDAAVRLFSRLVSSSNPALVKEAKKKIQEYFGFVENLIKELDSKGVVGAQRQAFEEEVNRELLDWNHDLYDSYARILGLDASRSDRRSRLYYRLRKVVGAIEERYWGTDRLSGEDAALLKRVSHLIERVNFNESVSPETYGIANASLYLGGDVDDSDAAVAEEAFMAFAALLGVQKIEAIETRRGSIFRRFLAFFQNDKTKQEIESFYKDGKAALRAQQLNKPRSEATEKLAVAASTLLASLEGFDNAILRLGELVVVKQTHNGITNVGIETISPELASKLEADPELLRDPRRLLSMLPQECITQIKVQALRNLPNE